MLASARLRATQGGYGISITADDIRAVWPADDICPVFGTVFRRGAGRTAASLDRINSAWGYEPGNIAVMSRRANLLKNDATVAELEQIVAWMRRQGLN